MRTNRFSLIVATCTLVLLATAQCHAQGRSGSAAAARPATDARHADDEARSPIDAGELEILTRGPLHEAFAALPVEQPTAPPLVRQKPPKPLGEQVPQLKPAGNAQWIPGYWHWNDEIECWVWVSGAWRIAPPNRHWMPGYWWQGADGSRWVSGFWNSGDSSRPTYVAASPRPQQEPEDVHAGTGEFRIPGHWLPQNDKFAWQPARLAEFKAGQIWIPSQYYWTPAGYVFVDGYWDYPFDRRGWLFAPLGLTDPAADPAQFTFSPDILLNLANISLELFARPAQRTYYFGDYDGPGHLRHGMYPVPRYAALHYEPIFSYLAWFHGRRNPNWLRDAQAALRSRTMNAAPDGTGNLTNLGSRARQTLIWLNEYSTRPAVRDHVNRLGPAQLAEVVQQIGVLRLAVRERRSDELDRSATETAAVLSARQAIARADRGAAHLGHLAAAADEIAGSVGAQSGSTNLKPRPTARRSGVERDDLNIDRFGSGEDLTADSEMGPGLRVEIAPSLYGTAAIAGRSFIATGGGPRGLSSRALIYNGLPMGSGNTLGGAGGISGGVPSFPSGIGSGYQGGSPTGGINAPGGSYGLGSPSGGGAAFYGAGGGGTGHGSPGAGT